MTNMKWIALALASSIALTAAAPVAAKERGGDRPAFSDLDTDGNGEVTLAEMEAFRAAKFAEIDTDGNGSLSAEELLAAREADSDRAERRINRMIERADANDNGTIELDEMRGGGERGAERFAEADADGSGGLSEAEMKDAKGKRGGKKGGKGKRGDAESSDG